MKITTKEVREVTSILDEIIEEYKKNHPEKKRDWRTYEEQVQFRLKQAFQDLKPLISEAVKTIKVVKDEPRGAKEKLTLEQKVLILLLQRLIGKSNRNMSGMLTLFFWLTEIDISYKTIERLYSDPLVSLALHNLHMLILKKKEVKEADCGGDGTGYSLTIKKHYASSAQRLKNKLKDNAGKDNSKKESKKRVYTYFFAIIDVKTRMYLGFGTGFTSEQEAYKKAKKLAKETGIIINSLRLDRYFSAQKYVKELQQTFQNISLYLIPKKNVTIKGSWEWKRMLEKLVKNTEEYLEEYFKRNQSESGFSEDKKRTGWKLGQKRPDRIDTANFCSGLWHNLYWLAD